MLRQRRRDESNFSPESCHEENKDVCIRGVSRFSILFAAAIIISLWLLLYSTAAYFIDRLPPLQHKTETDPDDRFVGVNAKNFLMDLAKIGIKTTGSYENEVVAVELIEKKIKSIMDKANDVNDINYDHQVASGAYYLDDRRSSVLSSYNSVQNIIVKIGPPADVNSSSSLLVNCHFDSAPASPGASDDGLNCAVMLEVLRLLSQQSEKLKNSVIFLFNGAEETPLQGSHGFITQHKWATNLKAFINLESCGAGGKETLFQTGPQHPWLVQLYKEAAEHPFGLVLAEDIFQGGLVPSDTDFRVFRDFGHIPGLDFAHCDNGFVYHTSFDDVDKIRDGVYQHTGDNLLALVKHILASEKFVDSEHHKEGRTVYFDLGGLYLITYSETTGIILNLAAVFMSVYTIMQSIFTYTIGMKRREIGKQFVMSLLVPAFGLTIALVFVISIAVVLDSTNSVLSWYSKPFLILPLYFAPTLIAFCLPPLLLNKIKSSNISDAIRAQIYCNGVQLMWTVFLFVAILTGLRSAYILLIAVFITTFTNCVLNILNLQYDVTKWLIAYSMSSIIPALYFVYVYILAMRLFIPITGRSGPHINPELFIGVLAALLCSLIFGYITPLILLVWKPWRLLSCLLVINLVTILLVITTPLGFPFAENAQQRILALHVDRKFHSEGGDIIKSDSGMWLTHLDRKAPGTYGAIPWFKDVQNIDADCSQYLYCGLPFYYTRIASVESNPGSWVPGAPPVFGDKDETQLILNSVEDITPDIKRLTFNVSGPHQMLFFLSPKEGAKLINWSFSRSEPLEAMKWGPRPTYIIRSTAGGYNENLKPTFFIDLQVSSTKSAPYLDIAIAGHYIEDMTKQKYDLKMYTMSFLTWAHVTTWSAAYRSYVF